VTTSGEDAAERADITDSFTRYRPVSAEGARIGVMSCLTCGAAIVLDPGDRTDMVTLHYRWHLQLEHEQGVPFGGDVR
jgi:hypothetical protein